VKIDVADPEARGAKLTVQRAERLERHVLKDQQLANRRALYSPSLRAGSAG
jgi:hypothetical protein